MATAKTATEHKYLITTVDKHDYKDLIITTDDDDYNFQNFHTSKTT